MRRDMHKVIVERPRKLIFGHPVRKGRPGRDVEDLPRRESMTRPYKVRSGGWKGKNQTDNLNPLYRYLLKQVGRPWNKVYSEICAHTRLDNSVQGHLRFHARDIVEVHVRVGKNGKPEVPNSCFWPRFYVDPRNGLLRVTRQSSRRRTVRVGEFLDALLRNDKASSRS